MTFPNLPVVLTFWSAIVFGLSFGQEACILTDTTCQCSTSTPSGTCIRSQGDGTCILGRCSEGYRCDCFGYELCGVSKCGQHIPIGGREMSNTKNFKCRMEPNGGTCIDAIEFLDTLLAANNAVADAIASQDDSNAHEADTLSQLAAIMDEKQVVGQLLKALESVADDVPEQDMEEIEAEAIAVDDAVEKGAALLVKCIEKAKKTADKTREARNYKRDTEKKEREIKEKNDKKIKLMEENQGIYGTSGRSMSNEDEDEMKRLDEEISRLTEERKKSARMCGAKAKEAKAMKKETEVEFKKCADVLEKARVHRMLCEEKANKAIEKVSQQ